jgi:hypothetical protein
MSGDGRIEDDFGGETRQFRVALGELRKIQIKCADGPSTIASRLARCAQVVRAMPGAKVIDLVTTGLGDWRVDDVREPILQGLIGGGLSPNEASRLVTEWIDARGFVGVIENASLALALVIGGVALPVGETSASPKRPTRARQKNSTSPTSTAPAPRSASPRAKSTT